MMNVQYRGDANDMDELLSNDQKEEEDSGKVEHLIPLRE